MSASANLQPKLPVSVSSRAADRAAQAGTAQVYHSTVLTHSADAVWAVIRDFNSYPAYIDGVTESHLEDDKRGDEVGCVRRFIYNGHTIRQTLTGHSDSELWFSHAGCDPLEWPIDDENVGPVEYANLVHVRRVTDGERAFVEWSLEFEAKNPSDVQPWIRYFENSVPVWLDSLNAYLARQATVALGSANSSCGTGSDNPRR